MKALVIEGPYKASINEVPYPKPGVGEVTIKVANTGICGTDIHIYKGEFLSPYPIIPGHEFSGVVHEIGESVSGYTLGERVCVDPSIFCGRCRFCLTNRFNHCVNWQAIGVTGNGSMAEYVAVPAKNLLVMPDNMSFEIGAFVEPMACVVHAMNRLRVLAGERVLLFGAGAMGQQLIQSLVKMGASELVVVDISEPKLQLAAQWGASRCILSSEIDAVYERKEYPYGFDVVVDATGLPQVIQQCFRFLGPAGKYLQFGVTAQNDSIQLSPFELYHKDWTLLGTMAINHTFIPAFDWVREGRVKLDHLISAVIPLEEAINYLQGPRDPNWMKVQIKM